MARSSRCWREWPWKADRGRARGFPPPRRSPARCVWCSQTGWWVSCASPKWWRKHAKGPEVARFGSCLVAYSGYRRGTTWLYPPRPFRTSKIQLLDQLSLYQVELVSRIHQCHPIRAEPHQARRSHIGGEVWQLGTSHQLARGEIEYFDELHRIAARILRGEVGAVLRDIDCRGPRLSQRLIHNVRERVSGIDDVSIA